MPLGSLDQNAELKYIGWVSFSLREEYLIILSSGHYLYGLRVNPGGSDTSTITSPVYPATVGRCCSFWYMTRPNHEFTASIIPSNGKPQTVWKSQAAKYGIWQPATFTIQQSTSYQVFDTTKFLLLDLRGLKKKHGNVW